VNVVEHGPPLEAVHQQGQVTQQELIQPAQYQPQQVIQQPTTVIPATQIGSQPYILQQPAQIIQTQSLVPGQGVAQEPVVTYAQPVVSGAGTPGVVSAQ